MIGALCFEKLDEHLQTAELSYFLKKDHWGQGLMTEAVRKFSVFVFYKVGLKSW